MAVTPFTLAVADATLLDLHDRLSRTRWPDAVIGAGWDYGSNLDYLRELVDYWIEGYDWRAAETAINRHEHLMVELEGEVPIHVLRQRSDRPDTPVLVLLHGWPDSFNRFYKLLPLLTDFDVIVPSLPGYGFSGRPSVRGYTSRRMAVAIAAVLAELGIERYLVHGGDVGSGVGESLAQMHPDRVRGLHLTDVPYGHLLTIDRSELSEPEKAFLKEGQKWQMRDGAYAMMHSTRPQSASVGLNDSPAGLAAWIVEKYRGWGDTNGDIESRFSKDELLTNLTIYWVTQTIGSSFRVYFEREKGWGTGSVDVPTAVATFPKDLVHPPREFADRFFNVVQWTEMDRGGHFAALEEPELLADDIKSFAALLD
ncbi:MAG: multidrug transporter [Pseudonocardiales bacterium]|nr:multidrug transporter [Pseudonocardiales bacterium]